MHLWYPKRFGFEVPPFRNTAEAVATFPLTAACVGVRLLPDDGLLVVAPHGLDDLLGGVCRHNPTRVPRSFYEEWLGARRSRWQERWPRLPLHRVEHTFVSTKGSAHSRFRRALDTRNPTLVLAAAAELRQVELADALSICLVLLDARSPLYSRAAVRWQARLCLEARGMELGEAAFVLGGLEALGGEHGEAVALALAGLLEARGLSAAARVLARWGSFALRPGRAAPEHGDT